MRRSTGLAPALALAACALALHTSARAADVSRISAVKLYPGSATVERVLRVAPGARQATFSCLPAALDAASLQVSAAAGIRVGELAVRQQPRELLGAACASPLDERIRALQDQIASLQAESSGIDLATGYFKSFGQASDGPRAGANPAQINTTAQALRQGGQTLLTRQHELARQQQALERDLKPLLAERERSAGAQARVSTVQITLATAQGGELHLSYQVRGPGWQPGYRATLDSAGKKLRLERLAQVAQSTGEDWDGVAITLSTGQPGAATQGPLPRPWRVGIEPPRTEAMEARPMAAPAPAPMLRAAPAAKAAADADTEPRFDVSVFQGTFATEFTVPQRVSVPSSGQQITLALGEQTLDTELLVRATPALDAHAYLIAQFAPPPGVWPAGPVQLYRDGAFVGTTRLDAAASQRNGLAFGRDELVSVRVERPEQQQGTGGFIGSRNQRTDSRRYVLDNRHRDAVTVQVLDAAPVSDNEQVSVESSYQPQPTTTRWHDQPGTVAWEQALAAGAMQVFSSKHVISWPKDERVQERR